LNLSLKGKLFLFIYSATHKNWYLLEFCKGCFVNLQNPTRREEMEKFNFFGQAHRSMSSPLSQCSTRPTEQRLFVVSMHAATHAPLVTSPAKAVGWRASYVTPLSRATIKLPHGTIFVFPSLFLPPFPPKNRASPLLKSHRWAPSSSLLRPSPSGLSYA
jgi:hypothetical protein